MSQDPFGLFQGDSALHTERATEENSPDLLGITFRCGICSETIQRFEAMESGDVSWIHARSWVRYDHDPDPIETTIDEHPLILCDFCGTTTVMEWAFEGDAIRAQEGNRANMYSHIWRACHECGPLVMAEDIDGLSRRLMSTSPTVQALRLLPDELEEIKARGVRLHSAFIPTIHTTRYIGPPIAPTRLTPQLLPKLAAGLHRFWNHPKLFEMIGRSPCSLPGIHSGIDGEKIVRYGANELDEQALRNHTRHLTAGLGVSELYWISEDFTSLAVIAGQDLTDFTLRREDMPSPFGLMVFARPVQEIQRPYGVAGIRAVSWTLVPGGIWLNAYIQGDDADPLIAAFRTEWRSEWGYLMGLNVGSGLGWGGQDFSDLQDNVLATVFATWLLLKQPGVAEQRLAPPDKKLARSYQRTGKKAPEVRVIDLRHQPRRKANVSRTGRRLEYRVRRKGHWKWIAFGPKHGQRRYDYVSQYIAGPDDAPFRPPTPIVRVLR